MPGLTGIEVLKDLRSVEDLTTVPVVLHSTKVLDEPELKFFNANNVTIFPKQSLTLADSASRIKELLLTLTRHARVNP